LRKVSSTINFTRQISKIRKILNWIFAVSKLSKSYYYYCINTMNSLIIEYDFLSEEEEKSASSIQTGCFDIVNFGFETSIQTLEKKKYELRIFLY
jgi:hypothetical protein